MAKRRHRVVVLDFGGQYAHLIANRVRRLGVFSEIKEPDCGVSELQGASGIILSGGPSSVYAADAPAHNKEIFALGIPLLGICYGHQLLAHVLGGEIKRGDTREYGTADLHIKKSTPLFSGLDKGQRVWMSHGDTVVGLPPGFEAIASTGDCDAAAMADTGKKLYGVQFHPEVTHTPNGMKILENFVFGVCKCKADWSMGNYVKEKTGELKEKAAGRNVFMLASGGVDSTVGLALLVKALGSERVYAMHVDNGFMRKNESAAVAGALKKLGHKDFHVVDASWRFYKALEGVVEPEEKRKIIGQLFVDVANTEIRKLDLKPEDWLLGQGTIYPDTIETGRTKHAAVIKTHHNRVESIKEMLESGMVIEPLDTLYKDEVRELGIELGLPESIVYRHPFPGPGLAIRALCSDGKAPNGLDKITEQAGAVAKDFGYKAVALPVKSVGVQGDSRTYRAAVALVGPLDWGKLEAVSTAITNRIDSVNRVCVLLKPDGIESATPVKGYLTRERLDVLRAADAITTTALEKHCLMEKLWQCPVILIPVGINGKRESIVLRPVESMEAMTARFAALDKAVVEEIAEAITALQGIGAVLYDITHKPPATICWE